MGKKADFDISAFVAAERGNGMGCWWRSRDFSDEQRALLNHVMFETRITAEAISRVLRDEWKIDVGAQSVRNHRAGTCRCKKTARD